MRKFELKPGLEWVELVEQRDTSGLNTLDPDSVEYHKALQHINAGTKQEVEDAEIVLLDKLYNEHKPGESFELVAMYVSIDEHGVRGIFNAFVSKEFYQKRF